MDVFTLKYYAPNNTLLRRLPFSCFPTCFLTPTKSSRSLEEKTQQKSLRLAVERTYLKLLNDKAEEEKNSFLFCHLLFCFSKEVYVCREILEARILNPFPYSRTELVFSVFPVFFSATYFTYFFRNYARVAYTL